ncbi:MAG: PEP-CTERM sorting domain-containing protein [Fimbriimonadaceae bacterium]|nr:MAG: PEP-CTERM sorting domain-containing protein [Fimbriimonadaceae bacterium]
MRNTILFAALAMVGAANAQSLWNQALPGSFDNTGLATENRPAGGRLSVLDTASGMTIFGFGANAANNTAKVADDFTVGGPGWIVQSATFWTYQTGATTTSINGGSWEIRTGSDPNSGGLVATGSFGGVTLTDIYRVTDTAKTDTQRRLQQVTVNFANVNLAPGTYTMVWGFTGTLASGPWQPPLTKTGTLNTGNAWQSLSGGAFAPIVDGANPQGLPFWIDGQVVPEPASMIALGAGIAALVARRKKA